MKYEDIFVIVIGVILTALGIYLFCRYIVNDEWIKWILGLFLCTVGANLLVYELKGIKKNNKVAVKNDNYNKIKR